MSICVCLCLCLCFVCVYGCVCRFDAWLGRGEEAGKEKAREEGEGKAASVEMGAGDITRYPTAFVVRVHVFLVPWSFTNELFMSMPTPRERGSDSPCVPVRRVYGPLSITKTKQNRKIAKGIEQGKDYRIKSSRLFPTCRCMQLQYHSGIKRKKAG